MPKIQDDLVGINDIKNMTFYNFDPYSVIPELYETDQLHARNIEALARQIKKNNELIHNITEYEQNVVALIQHMDREIGQLRLQIQLLEARIGSS